MCNDNPYSEVALPDLARMLSYAARVLADAPEDHLEDVREDLVEAALLVVPAAEYVQETAAEEGSSELAPQPTFLPAPKPAPRYLTSDRPAV